MPAVGRLIGPTALAFALAACTAVPSRVAIALAGGTERAFHFAGGLLCDVATAGPVFVVALALLAARPRLRRAGLVLVGVLFVVALVAENAATAFRLERGVLPGPIDLREGVGHHDFLFAEAPRVLAGRFLLANVACVAIAIVILRRLRARTPRASAFAVALVACGGLFFASQRANAYGNRVNNPDVLASPSAAFVKGLLQSGHYDGSPTEIRRLIGTGRGTPEAIAEGARAMGLDPASARRLADGPCDEHPLARSLDEPGGELVRAARELSRATFTGTTIAPIVLHVSLESVRADDLHAFDARAPIEVAPFLDEVHRTSAFAIPFAHAHQSGIRTSHALAAVTCGIGALPFYLSASRDLGVLPLRCLPDVLGDAGFRSRAYYGHEFVFDDMATFFEAHHVDLHGRNAFPESAPHGVWNAVSDATVYAAAVDDAARSPEPQWDFVLTLSHHAPYEAPQDMAPASRAAIDDVCRSRDLRGENCDRLRTMRYADDALRSFVASLEASPAAARAIVVVAADHTVHRWSAFGDERPDGLTHVPLFVYVPRALRDRAVDRAAFDAAFAKLRALAASTPISNADVPALVLALLSESPLLRALPASARWHTIGGQATSPFFRSITGRGVLHGVDAHGGVFDVAASGEVRPSGIRMESLRGPDDVANAKPYQRASIAFLAELLAPRCSR